MHSLDFDGLQASNSPLRRADARLKIVCTIAVILSILALTHWQTALAVFAACVFIALCCKVPLRPYFKSLLYPFYIITVISIIQPFTYGYTAIARTPVFSLPIFVEGVEFGMLIFSRCLAAVCVLVLLVQTTPIIEVMGALERFHVPSVLLDTALLMFRYIHVISEEAEAIHRAQQSRCGYSKSVGYLGKLRNYGTLFGMLLVRSYERAVAVGNAMLSRGYCGEMRLFTFESKPLPFREVLYGIILFSALALLLMVDWLLMG
ncbi:MAG: cobalt ECF transporter T component CbiQ [Candidatus Bathyarchaeota archaeon]|nr:cobalt ECF transporter T component CbiQ [Candidatus Bathyarchaeota archaeon]MCX8177221.1 cobalt ECF transporter T component CbiQ [Candidatus Bathyarchaeota archaeon]MDW8193536.1 cobalt ECF transporter T component CbiQ [Nitrososphaerota archaeon]